jgi:hypothetical protein
MSLRPRGRRRLRRILGERILENNPTINEIIFHAKERVI